MELVAAEPLTVDPVDVAYDEFGRAYVVEMRGYPLPEKPDQMRPDPISQVRLLFDDNNDGRFDRSTVFVDKLDWPTSVCCWKRGVFILDAPDVWYARDADGDGIADERRKVLTGFKKENVQALANSLKWGLDHRIHGGLEERRNADHPGQPEAGRSVGDPPRLHFRSGRRDGRGRVRRSPVRGLVRRLGEPLPLQHPQPDPARPAATGPAPPQSAAADPEPAPRRRRVGRETLPVFRISPVEAWREYRARRWVQERVNHAERARRGGVLHVVERRSRSIAATSTPRISTAMSSSPMWRRTSSTASG